MRSNKKEKRKEAMQKYVYFVVYSFVRLLAGDPLATPLTDKFFKLQLG